MRVLSTRVNNLKNEMNPTPSVRPTRGNPKARTSSKSLWMTKTVRLFLGGPANTETVCTVQNLASAIGFGTTPPAFRVLGLKAWNYTTAASNTNYLRVSCFTALLNNDSEGTPTLVGEDVGNSSHLAGVNVEIPDLLAANFATSQSTVGLFGLYGAPVGSSLATAQTYVCDVQVRFQST